MVVGAQASPEDFFFSHTKVKLLQRYIPDITVDDVKPGPSGVRAQVAFVRLSLTAQALGADGKLVDDFLFDTGGPGSAPRILNVVNAPSPGATSSLAIAETIVERARAHFRI